MSAATLRHAVGHILRAQREMRGIGLSEMAERMGYANVSGWSRVETGDTVPTVDHLARAGAILEVRASEILRIAEALYHAVPSRTE